MKIAICEDDQKDRVELFLLIQNYLQHNGFQFEIHVFSTGDELLKALADNRFSLLFLDIYLSQEVTDGMEIARRIRRMELDLPIIFTTHSCDFAVESYEVDALYYLVKPVTSEKLETAMKKCRKLLEDSLRYITVVSGRKTPVFTSRPSFMQRLSETALCSTPQKATYGLIWRLIKYCKIWVCRFYVVTEAIL